MLKTKKALFFVVYLRNKVWMIHEFRDSKTQNFNIKI